MDILTRILKTKNLKDVSNHIGLDKNTVKRWCDKNHVPNKYIIELMKLAQDDIDYSKFTEMDKDQFYSNEDMVQFCYRVFVQKMSELNVDIKEYTFIEPSAGNGSFLNVLPSNCIAMDIEPKHPNVLPLDYLSWTPPRKDDKYIVFGNPPFGLRGHLALQFLNHSSKFSDFVCFILPPLFISDGKGSPRKRVQGLNLIHSVNIPYNEFKINSTTIKINVIFQIWSKQIHNKEYELKTTTDLLKRKMKIYSLSDGGTPSTTRNKKMLYSCHRYLPSTCFGKENMKVYHTFNELPNRRGYGIVFLTNKTELEHKLDDIDWSQVAFRGTNSSYNLRTSKISEMFN